MVDIGLAAKKTMTLHAPIKLLLKSPLLAHFHSVSFCLVSGQDLQVSGCDIRDSMLSTPNRLYKDARQKNSNTACAFICLGKERGREGKGVDRVIGEGEKWESKETKRKWTKKNRTRYGYGFLWNWEHRGKNTKKKKKEKRVEIGKHFFLLSPVIAGPGRHLYSTRRKC